MPVHISPHQQLAPDGQSRTGGIDQADLGIAEPQPGEKDRHKAGEKEGGTAVGALEQGVVALQFAAGFSDLIHGTSSDPYH